MWGGAGQQEPLVTALLWWGEACAQGSDCWALSFPEDSSKDLKLLIKHLLELLELEGASAHGRDNALNLLIKVVPRKSPKETNNSLSLWVIDQGEQRPVLLGIAALGSACAPCSAPHRVPGPTVQA